MVQTKNRNFFSTFRNKAKHSGFINHIRNPEHKRIASKFKIGNQTTGRLNPQNSPPLQWIFCVELRVFVFNEFKVRSSSKIDLKYSKIKKSCNYQCASFFSIKYLLGLDVRGSTRNSALFTCWSRLP